MLETNPSVLLTIRAPAAVITLNRPERYNALTLPMMQRLREALIEAEAAPSVAAVILTATGPGFCGGQDLRVLAQTYEHQPPAAVGDLLREHYHAVIAAMGELRQPVIAAIQGVAAGGGWALALACDLRIAAASARFVPAFARLGFVPDMGGTSALVDAVGYARALEFALLTHELNAEDAAQWGLVNCAVADDALMPTALEWAERLATLPPEGVALTKRALRAARQNAPAMQRSYEASLQSIAAMRPEHHAALDAFTKARKK
jgi:2-(1,2-epoxy-1,2-dihydrophenyl)acetyl-CoA isomerase